MTSPSYLMMIGNWVARPREKRKRRDGRGEQPDNSRFDNSPDRNIWATRQPGELKYLQVLRSRFGLPIINQTT